MKPNSEAGHHPGPDSADGSSATWESLPYVVLSGLGVLCAALALLQPRMLTRAFSSTALSATYLPHGFCYLWDRQLVELHITSDAVIGLSYLAISISLGIIAIRYRRYLNYHWTIAGFGTFIVACGLTHVMEIVVLWRAYYWLAGDIKFVTALASVAVAATLPFLIPKIGSTLTEANFSKRNERRFLAASNGSHDAFYILESERDGRGTLVDFRFNFANENGADLLSSTPKELEGKLLCVSYPVNITDGFFEKYKKVVETGVPVSEEFAIHADKIKATWLRYQVVKLDDGVAITTTNISNLKLAELNARKASVFNRSLISSSTFSMITTDLDFIITSMNPAAERMLGYTEEEVVGKVTPMVFHDAKEIAKRAVELSGKFGVEVAEDVFVLQVNAQRGMREDAEWSYIRKDGSTFAVQLVVSGIPDDSGEIVGYLGIAHDITERKRAAEYISHIALHDALTSLPTRMLLRDRLETALIRSRRNQSKVALLVMDLDGFKRINDSLGHHVGDELLISVAARLRSTLRQSDTVARMGGDEFVVLLEGLHATEEAEKVTAKVLLALRQPIKIDGELQSVTASVGICIYPDHAEDGETLLRNADTAMYFAKADGRNTYQVFSQEMASVSVKNRAMQSALDVAVAQNEFELVYQPQVSLATGRVIGVEALLRWHSKKLGSVSPQDFIPLAEESGSIVPIGEWVLRTSCRAAMEFQRKLGRPMLVAVNISARQFQHTNLHKVVEEALLECGLSPWLLELEITESVLLSDSPKLAKMLERIRALGVRISLDDFGTGYSSLSYVLRFNVDRIKIDRSFIAKLTSDTNSYAITHAIIGLARGLKIEIVAEGVEDAATRDLLLLEGCDAAQGFYYSPGVRIEDLLGVVTFLEAGAPSAVEGG
jgi:diguanylate cyclase (GGDEF)-like protein/PAS domain S-box-containing protein